MKKWIYIRSKSASYFVIVFIHNPSKAGYKAYVIQLLSKMLVLFSYARKCLL